MNFLFDWEVPLWKEAGGVGKFGCAKPHRKRGWMDISKNNLIHQLTAKKNNITTSGQLQQVIR